jgi:hypothetical protein
MGRASLQGTPWHIDETIRTYGTGKSIPMCIYIKRRKCINPEAEFFGKHCDINICKKATKTPKGMESIRDIKLERVYSSRNDQNATKSTVVLKKSKQYYKNKPVTANELDKIVGEMKKMNNCTNRYKKDNNKQKKQTESKVPSNALGNDTRLREIFNQFK